MDGQNRLTEIMNRLYEKEMRLNDVKDQLSCLRREESEIENETIKLKKKQERF